jgi:hypothetical protein
MGLPCIMNIALAHGTRVHGCMVPMQHTNGDGCVGKLVEM